MATLTSAQRDAVAAEVHRRLSGSWLRIGVDKSAVRAVIDEMDSGLESAESTILGNVSPAANTWLTSRPTIARAILEYVAQSRRENL
jgi:hypothetical protein